MMNGTEIYFSQIIALLAISLGVSAVMGLLIGEERKAKWFKKKLQRNLFTRRGPLGEICHFGYPCTKEGYMITGAMVLISGVLFFVIP